MSRNPRWFIERSCAVGGRYPRCAVGGRNPRRIIEPIKQHNPESYDRVNPIIMSALPIAKKRRLVIINKKEQSLRATNSTPPLGGGTPLPLERSSPPLGGGTPRSSPPLGGGTPLTCTRFNNKTWQEYQDWKNTNQQTYEQIYKRPLKCIYGAPREISHKKIPPQTQILVIEMNNDENRIMGIGQIQNQTASEVYRSPSAVVPLANAHSTPASGNVLNPAHNARENPLPLPPTNRAELPLPPTNRAELPSRGGGTPSGTPSGPPSLPFKKIFSDRNYTRYIYIGNSHYATREELDRNHTQSAQYINEHLANTITMPQTPHHQEETILQYLERLLFKGPRHMKRGSGITGVTFISDPSKNIKT
jgi:hypothetical protein